MNKKRWTPTTITSNQPDSGIIKTHNDNKKCSISPCIHPCAYRCKRNGVSVAIPEMPRIFPNCKWT